MKKKSKWKKCTQNTGNRSSKPHEWLYMNPTKVSVKEIAAGLLDLESVKTQVWEAAGVLEIELTEAKSIDIEQTQVDLRDEYSNEFLQSHQVEALFYVTIDPENYEAVEQIMKTVVAQTGGFFCGDTENFEPVVK